MAQPQPYNRRKRFFIEMSRTQLLISIAAVLFVLSWVFILGIIVGRGIVADTITSAMKTQIQKLQQEKKSLMDKYLGAEQEKTASSEQILKPQLDFYDHLSKKNQEPLVMKVPQPTLPPTTTTPQETKAPAETPKTPVTQPSLPKPLESAGNQASALHPPEKKIAEPFKAPAPKPMEPVVGKAPTPVEKKIAEPPKTAAVQTGDFVLQLGAYREEATAQTVIQRLSGKGYQAQITAKELPAKGGKWYRVRIGLFKNREEAEKMARRLEHDGFQSIVIGNKN
jgi:cell division protein FtsN